MFPALGLHQYFEKRCKTYKDQDEGWGMDIPSNTMESDTANTLVEDRVAISAEIVPGRTPQRRSNRQALQNASATIKSMYQRQEGGVQVSGA